MRYAGLAVLMYFLVVRPAVAGEVRTMTLDDRTSTSDCIGDPKTPLCVAETVEACFIRMIKGLCETVGADFSAYEKENATPVTPDSYAGLYVFHYKQLASRVLTATDIPDWATTTDHGPWAVGDTALLLSWEACIPEDDCITESRDDPKRAYGEGCAPKDCSQEGSPATYITRGGGDRWKIVRRYMNFEFHGDLWNRK